VVFDPDPPATPDRVRWQVFRRVGKRGLVRVEASHGDRVLSRALGCWLRAVGHGPEVRVRLGTGPKGEALFPTDDEERARAVAEREQAVAEREQAVAERQQAVAERQQAVAERDRERAVLARAEAEIARLRAELARGKRRK